MGWGRCTALASAALLLAGCGAFGIGDADGKGGSDGPSKTFARPPAGKPAQDPAPGDFNGDGYDDLATVLTSTRKAKNGGKYERNTLTVVYGSAKGLRPEWSQRLPAGTNDYGAAIGRLLRADLDGDGFTDLATYADGTKLPRATYVLYGGPRGLSKRHPVKAEAFRSGGSGPDAGFRPAAAGDFDGDGHADLFDGRTILFGPFPRGGAPARQGEVPGGHPNPVQAIAGDYNADGRTDVALTYPWDAKEYDQNDDPPTGRPPQIDYYQSGPGGLRNSDPVPPGLDSMSTYDGPRQGVAGDVDGDGVDDLVANGEHYIEGPGAESKLTLIHGSKAGPGRGKASRILAGSGTWWGSTPMIGDVTGDKKPDLVASRPGFSLRDTDRLLLFPGGAEGPAMEGHQVVRGDDPDLPGDVEAFRFEPEDLLDVDGDGRRDLIVRSHHHARPYEDFVVLSGTPKGFVPKTARHFTSDDVGVRVGRR
ncbi:FG-GAP repeat domain-containing protein [Streptomyces sp. G5(2025)]|uniref:FG-GAP repeat domain-containing protein n=1 Tax=Streptomyces sp. G5(2025) TaxID=3406628 RepID=UPI003C201563